MAVVEKLLAARKDPITVACDGATTSGARFEYASAGAITEAARKALNDCGLSYRIAFSVLESNLEVPSGDKTARWVRVQVECYLSDIEEESQPFVALGEAIDSGDNATSKAQTDAMKSLWIHSLAIVVAPRSAAASQPKQPRQDQGDPACSVKVILELRKKKDLSNEGFNNLVKQVNGGSVCKVLELSEDQRKKLMSTLQLVADKQG